MGTMMSAIVARPTMSRLHSSSLLNFFISTTTTTIRATTTIRTTTTSNPFGRLRRRRAFTTAAMADDRRSSSDGFFAEESVSWGSLGVSDHLSRALCNAGFEKPSLVQAACIPLILSGKDVVVAAETGSGKTHGYLVPLMNKLCCSLRSDRDQMEVTERSHGFSLVLCPNVMLCEQVARMANGLCDDSGVPILRAFAVSGRKGWPVDQPDVVVSTPVALLNYLYAVDPERLRRSDFLCGVKYVVFDEADLLLCGSFQNQVIRLINMFRYEEKVLSRTKNSDVGSSKEINAESADQFELEQDPETASNYEEDSEIDDVGDVENVVDDTNEENLKETKVGLSKGNDWRRVRKVYERSKQYIFVAATLPANGKMTAGGVLKRMFPDAVWTSGNYLHRHNPRLEQRWVEVTVETQVDVLINAVKEGLRLTSNGDVSRTMVFANTVDAVESVVKILQTVGIECMCYHSDSSLEQRTKNLIDFREKGGVFVCTDAAARGLDVPNVSHVIQAEFATSAVDFLHRIGRTARAGQFGLVTSLYTESNRDLVAAVREAGKHGLPLEKAFSRKRGFRNKIKKGAVQCALCPVS
ncbi:hypothetical protein Scep_021507 [Stephania cephalantha]|uniref:RNA helicase n=1 Tax=Stephania cephalantha TaxID=152367 RepID=A0AAP0FBC3_9MAGN